MIVLTVLVALVTALIAGLSPALWVSRADGSVLMRDSQKGSTGRGFARIAKVLVIVEVALTIVLLVGAGTFIESLAHMTDFDTGVGVPAPQVLTAQLEFDFGAPDGPDTVSNDRQFLDRLAKRLNAEPRVLGATLADTVPGARLGSHEYIGALGAAIPPGGYAKAQFGVVDRYFAKTYGLRMVDGRFFDERDAPDARDKSVVVNRELADRLWPGQSAIGQHLVLNPQRKTPTVLSVIGVVQSLHLDSPLEARLPAALVVSGQYRITPAALAIHVQGDPGAFIPEATRLIREERRDAAVFDWRTLDALVAARRASLGVVGEVFLAVGALGLMLAAVGIYGVLSFAVAQRTREIGIRRALGAGRKAIVVSVGGRLSHQVLWGLGIGLALALPWSAILAKSLMQARLIDPLVVLGTACVVILCAALACSIPLARAMRVDPMVALRLE
jgi:predicted permease